MKHSTTRKLIKLGFIYKPYLMLGVVDYYIKDVCVLSLYKSRYSVRVKTEWALMPKETTQERAFVAAIDAYFRRMA